MNKPTSWQAPRAPSRPQRAGRPAVRGLSAQTPAPGLAFVFLVVLLMGACTPQGTGAPTPRPAATATPTPKDSPTPGSTPSPTATEKPSATPTPKASPSATAEISQLRPLPRLLRRRHRNQVRLCRGYWRLMVCR